MSSRKLGFRFALTTVLLAGATLAAIVLFWDADNLVSRLVGLDVSFVTLPATLCAALLTIGRLALCLSHTQFAARAAVRRSAKPQTNAVRLAAVLAGMHRMLTDVGWAALVLVLFSSVTAWPGVRGDQQAAAEVVAPAHYLGGLESFVIWGALLLAPFIGARAVATVRPDVGAIVGWPWVQLAAFGIAYALLSVGGAFPAAFGLAETWPLLGFGVALAFAYAASAIGRAMAIWPQARRRSLRWLRAISEAAWPLALSAGVVILAREAERVSAGPEFAGPGSVDASYLQVLHALTLVEMLTALIPFALINYVRALSPGAARIVRAPIWHLTLIAVAYLLFSSSGVIATAFEVNFPWMLRALVGATALVYAASLLRNVASIEVQRWYLRLAMNILRALSAAARAAALAAVVLAALTYLPEAGAFLLEQPASRVLWEDLLPLVAGLYEARYAIAASMFATAAAFLLVRAMSGQLSVRVEALMSAVSCLVAGCLIWMIAANLSEYGHGFPFAGAVAAAGMFSLALGRLASAVASSSNSALADVAGWLSASWVRGFMLGAAAIFYVLLLRPVVYELVGLAALYEYVALLALLLTVSMSVVNRLRVVARPADTLERSPGGWQHHEQTLEHRVDHRSALPDSILRRYLERGDWLPLWAYLFALLYRSESSLEAMAAVCTSLRRGAVAPPAWAAISRNRQKRARSAALHRALDTVGRSLADSETQLRQLNDEDIHRLGASYVERGTDPEPLVVALIVALCQRGARPEHAVERWFYLLETPGRVLDWLGPGWRYLAGGPRTASQRLDLVNEEISLLSDDAFQTGRAPTRGRLVANAVGGRT
ncbi:MAG: hypothetical protein F4X58_13245 [Chloroflexi bacterium]|nr:hypothetical protein [Chloroflexota bacterium]